MVMIRSRLALFLSFSFMFLLVFFERNSVPTGVLMVAGNLCRVYLPTIRFLILAVQHQEEPESLSYVKLKLLLVLLTTGSAAFLLFFGRTLI